MRRRASALSLIVVFLLAQGIVSWLPAAAVGEASPKIMRFFWGDGFPDMLEPQQTESGTVDMTFLNYEGLTRLDEEMHVVPGATESWEFSAGGKTLTFHLREGLVFSDGVPVTAEHFRYAVEHLCSPELDSASAIQLFDIAGCEEAFAGAEDGAAALGARTLDEQTLGGRT